MNKRKLLLFGLSLVFAGVIGGSILTLATPNSYADQQTIVGNGESPTSQPQPTTVVAPPTTNTVSTAASANNPPSTSVPPTSAPQTVNQVSNPGSSPSPCH